jgi:DNA-binding beta-propeller fold protein YncE
MTLIQCLTRSLPLVLLLSATALCPAQIVISGNENKVDLTGGGQKVVPNAPPDSISILDFAQFPPKVTTLDNVPNTVVGPPSNIAIHPSGRMALISNSLKLDPTTSAGTSPETFVHVLDLSASPPKVVGKVEAGLQPSGISFTPDGKHALVADRADGTVAVLAVDGANVKPAQMLKVAEPAESVSDVAVSPDGKLALASVQKSGYLALLNIDDAGRVSFTGRKFSTYGQPYRVVITPDGELAVTAGQGFGNGLDQDALTIIDLKAAPGPRTTAYVPVGTVPESLELSPDGRLCAVVVMEGSNTAADNPIHSGAGAVVILERTGRSFAVVQKIPVGRIPEGVAFTGDGKYLLVQCHPDRKIWVFRVNAGRVEDSGVRIDVPGMPSSLRALVKH